MLVLEELIFHFHFDDPSTEFIPSPSAALGLRVALPFVDNWMPVHNLLTLENLAKELVSLEATRPLRRQHPAAVIPAQTAETVPVDVDLPQMGTGDYVRRTIVLGPSDGGTTLQYAENPDEHQRRRDDTKSRD